MTGPQGLPGDAMTSGRHTLLGVDLGTSHTVAMLRRPDGRTRPLLFDGRPLLPSAVYRDTTHRLHVGRDALRLGLAEPARIEPHPKRHIDADRVLLGGTEVPVAGLLAALLGAVAREAVATAGFLPPAVLTHPAAWGARRRAVLIDALARAGWPADTELVPEPVAAARYFADVLRRPVPAGSALAVFDFGGGTLDVAVVRNEGPGPDGRPRFEVASCGGLDDLGGLDVDAALVDHLGTSLAGSEPQAWAALTDPDTLAQWRARRQFWEDVRGAKEMLSRSALAPVPVPGVEHAAHLTRDELEAAAGPLIRRGVAEAAAVIEAAGTAPSELAGLFLVGGSSRVPMVARLLHGELGIAPTVLEQPELPVAEGAIVVGMGALAVVAGSSAESDVAASGASPSSPGTAVVPSPASVAAASVSVPATAFDPASGTGGARSDDDLRYRPGVADAATPTPTPATAPGGSPPASPSASTSRPPSPVLSSPAASSPLSAPTSSPPTLSSAPPGAAAGGSAPEYAEPVDPWATGEAAAFAASGGSPLFPGSGAPAGTPPHGAGPWLASTHAGHGSTAVGGGDVPVRAYRKTWFWLLAAAVVVVVGVGATLAVIFWPGYRALDYRSLDASPPVVVAPEVPVTIGFNDAAVIGDRAYFAGVSDDGELGVVAADANSGKRLWGSRAAGRAERWERMVALPGAVVVFTDTDLVTDKRTMVVLGAERGERRWQRTIGDDDGVLFVADTAVLVDRAANRLLGLDLTDGTTRWDEDDVTTDSGTRTSVVAVTTPADLSGPAAVSGEAFAPDLDDDTRIVQVGADKSFRVLDAVTGDIAVPLRQGSAGPDDEKIAHDGRFIVVEANGTSQRLVSYDLAKQGEPDLLYSAPAGSRMTELTPCGPDRVCWVETAGYNARTTRVKGVNAAEGGDVWDRGLPDVDSLVPVGDHLLAGQSTPTPRVSLLDAGGDPVWNVEGRAARLDGGNLLRFNTALSTTPENPALFGEHLGDEAEPLGALSDVRSQTCSWNTSVIACVADENFIVQRFAG